MGYSLSEVLLDLFSQVKTNFSALVINLLPFYLRSKPTHSSMTVH